MSTRLYEELGIPGDATREQVRKAYRKKALLTHPDRLPQGATDDQRAISQEQFRKVNHAYEVLSDPVKRQEYDRHGIWPPPAEPQWSPTPQASGSNYGRWPPRSNTFPDPFMSNRTGFPGFHFSDPFSLFEEIFAGTPFARSAQHRHPFFSQSDPFGHTDVEDLLDELDRDPFGTRSFPSFSPFPSFPAFPSLVFSTSSSGNGTRWVSESFSSSMINGVTQSIHKRTDSEGNEHVTRTFPGGQQTRTINGIEQPAQQRIAEPSRRPSTNRYLPQPSPQLLQNDPRTYVTSDLPPPYATSSQSQNYHVQQSDGHDYRPHHYRRRSKHHHPPSEQWSQP